MLLASASFISDALGFRDGSEFLARAESLAKSSSNWVKSITGDLTYREVSRVYYLKDYPTLLKSGRPPLVLVDCFIDFDTLVISNDLGVDGLEQLAQSDYHLNQDTGVVTLFRFYEQIVISYFCGIPPVMPLTAPPVLDVDGVIKDIVVSYARLENEPCESEKDVKAKAFAVLGLTISLQGLFFNRANRIRPL